MMKSPCGAGRTFLTILCFLGILPVEKGNVYKVLREGLALLAEIVYIIYMKEKVARAMVAKEEVRFLYELCCSCEK